MFCLNDDHHLATSLKSRDHANIRCHLRRKSRHHANFALCGQTESTLSCFSKHLSIKRGDEGISSVFVASYDGNFSTAIDIFFFISAVHDTINVFDLHIGHFPLSGHVP